MAVKPIVAIKRYFFDNPITGSDVPKVGMKEISEQVKALTPDEKRELAEGAAKELGEELDWSSS